MNDIDGWIYFDAQQPRPSEGRPAADPMTTTLEHKIPAELLERLGRLPAGCSAHSRSNPGASGSSSAGIWPTSTCCASSSGTARRGGELLIGREGARHVERDA